MPAAHPIRALLARYKDIWSEAWQQRKDLEPPRRSGEELEFLPAAISLRDTPVHPLPRRLMWGILVLFVLALVWSVVGRMDVVAVGRGKVVPGSGSKQIQASELAVVRAVHVKDGQVVARGDALVDFDASIATADVERLSGEVEARQVDAAIAGAMLESIGRERSPTRLRDTLSGLPATAVALADIRLLGVYQNYRSEVEVKKSEMRQLDTQLAAAQASLRALEDVVPLSREISANMKTLSTKEFVARSQFLDKEQSRLTQERELIAQRYDIQQTLAARSLAQRQRVGIVTRWRQNMLDMQNKATEEGRSLARELDKARRRLDLMHLTAPVDGTVQQVAVKTEGGVVQEAQTLMIVVPAEDPIEIEAMLPNKDIGFVRPGMPVEVKIDAFEFTKYGLVAGRIATISNDAIETEQTGPVFAMRIIVEKVPPAITPSPGMSLSAEVMVGSRRIIEYFLSPLNVYLHDSFRER